jgi:DNA-binding beta-propeller fold protein YncE
MVALLASLGSAFSQTANPKHEVVPFAAPPSGQKIWNLARSVAVDRKGSVIIFRGSEPSVLIYNRAGQLQKAWNLPDGKNVDRASIKATPLRTAQEGLYPDAHSIDIDREGFLWLTERSRHIVYKYTMEGKWVMTLGKDGVAGDSASTEAFGRPSDVVIGANGDIFVADDGNFRVVKFSKDGRFQQIIGGVKGTGPGQFGVPHALSIDSKGRLLVLDQHQDEKGKSRVQIFDQNGEFLEQWKLEGDQPTGIAITPDDAVYVADTNGTSITVFKNGQVVDVMRNLPIRPHNLAWDAATRTLYMTEPEGAKERPGGVVLKMTSK